MSYNLTKEERQIAINQLTSLDNASSGIATAYNQQPVYAVVPIPPSSHGQPERWVAVEPRSKNIDTNIRQPDPEKVVLCVCRNNRGCISYCYGDKISCYIISSIIFTVIFTVITTPLLLLCCVPMIRNLVKVNCLDLSLKYQCIAYCCRLAEMLKTVIIQVLEKSATSGCVVALEHPFGHLQSLFWFY